MSLGSDANEWSPRLPKESHGKSSRELGCAKPCCVTPKKPRVAVDQETTGRLTERCCYQAPKGRYVGRTDTCIILLRTSHRKPYFEYLYLPVGWADRSWSFLFVGLTLQIEQWSVYRSLSLCSRAPLADCKTIQPPSICEAATLCNCPQPSEEPTTKRQKYSSWIL